MRGLHGLPLVHLGPGEIYVGQQPAVVTTILGSCVAVTMFYEAISLGMICHGIMPVHPVGLSSRTDFRTIDECFRYVDCAVRYMVRCVEEQRVPLARLSVKIFGGSDRFSSQEGYPSVGSQNVAVALNELARVGLRPEVRQVGGRRGRKIHFLPHTGEVWLKQLGADEEPEE